MRARALPAMVAVVTALALAPPAQAGLGGLLKAMSALGKGAAKAGGAVKAGKAGLGALKGAKLLGATVAAERVFVHVADDGARVGLYLADDGAGALKVVTEAGDELAHTPASLKTYVDDLDAMADVTPEAGVDLYLDADLLPRLAELDVGPNTRLWLANIDGPSLPLRKAADGALEVAVVAEPGGAGRLWFRLGGEAVEAAVELAMRPTEGRDVVVADPDCTGAIEGARPVGDVGEAIRGARGTLVVVTDRPLDPAMETLAVAHDLDLVVLGLADICPTDSPPLPEAELCVRQAHAATTVGQLWAAGSTAAAPLVVSGVVRREDWLAVQGSGLIGLHRVATALIETSGSDDPPPWVILVSVVVGLGVLAIKFALSRKPSAV